MRLSKDCQIGFRIDQISGLAFKSLLALFVLFLIISLSLVVVVFALSGILLRLIVVNGGGTLGL